MSFFNLHFDRLTQIQEDVVKLITLPQYQKATLFYPKGSIKYIHNNKDLYTEILKLDLINDILAVAVIVINPNSRIPVHKDDGEYTYSLNIPLSGYEDSYVNFYKTNNLGTLSSIPQQEGHSSSPVYNRYDILNCELISSHKSDQPYVMDTKIPHDVENRSNSIRLCLLIRLKNSANEKILVLREGIEPSSDAYKAPASPAMLTEQI